MNYYDTTKASQQDRASYQQKAKSQSVAIMKWFCTQRKPASPSEVLNAVFNGSVPITSVRRSMTDLSNAGVLKKTNETVDGIYGRPEHKWTLAA